MASGDVCVPGAAGFWRFWKGACGRWAKDCALREDIFRRRVKLQVQLHVPTVWDSVTETLRPSDKGTGTKER